MGELRALPASGGNALRPANNERVGNAAVEDVALPTFEGCVASHCPASSVVSVGVFGAPFIVMFQIGFKRVWYAIEKQVFVERSKETTLTGSTVIGNEHDQCVVQVTKFIPARPQAPDVVISMGKEGSENFHLAGKHAFSSALRLSQPLPNLDRRKLCSGRQDAQFELALIHLSR